MSVHPLVIHFPLVLALIWPLVDLVGFLARSRAIAGVGLALLLAALVASFVGVATGQWAYDAAVEAGHSPELLATHSDPADLLPWVIMVLSLVRTLGVLRLGRAAHGASIVLGIAAWVLVLLIGRSGGALVYQHGVGVSPGGGVGVDARDRSR